MTQIQKDQILTPQNKRLFKLKTKHPLKLDSFNQLDSTQNQNKYFINTHLHVPGKINFHELLSLPLEKQIQRENSIKQNQTFCLKFQPQTPTRQLGHHSKESLKKIGNKNLRFFSRNNLTAEKVSRSRNESQKQQIGEIKQASKTMYFRPLGKIAKITEHQSIQRKSLQLARNVKNKENHRFQLTNSSYKDKLLMLLQIRKQERNERKLNSSFNNGFNSYRQFNQMSMIDGLKDKIEQSSTFREYKKNLNQTASGRINYKKRFHSKNMREQTLNQVQLSPWYLLQNAEDF